MQVVYDLTPSIQNHAGIGRYTENLTHALVSDCPPDEQIGLFYNDPQLRTPNPPLNLLPTKNIRIRSKFWRFATLVAYFLGISQDKIVNNPDIFLATDHLLPFFTKTQSVLVVHDLSFKLYPETHLPLNRWFLCLMMPRFMQATDSIIAVSECTKQAILNNYSVPMPKIHVVYEGVAPYFQPINHKEVLQSVYDRYVLPQKFLLYVGTIEPRKNLPVVFEALHHLQHLDFKLVIAGKKGWLYQDIVNYLEVLNLTEKVVFTGYVPDDDLPALYNLADAFVFPSLYEGFGLPVLEAMACGTPVLCSNTSSLPEIASDAAILLPPNDVKAWEQAISQIMQNRTIRAELSQKGLKQAKKFTWTNAAHQTREIYREAYAHRFRRPHCH